MSITERIKADVKAAMKEGDKEKLQVLRMILSQLQLGEKEAGGDFGEAGEIKVLAAEKKRRLQAADGFRQGGREESAAREEREAELIETYLPRGLDEADLAELVEAAIADCGASGMGDMGKVMSTVMPRVAGRADGKVVSEIVRQRLSG